MCDSIADGGRRCATHTRPPYEAALARVEQAAPGDKSEARASGIVEVSAHASTRSGAQDVTALIEEATEAGDHDQAAWLTTCRRLGESQRQAANEIRRAIRAQRERASLGPVRPGDILCLSEAHTHLMTDVRRGTYVRVIRQATDGTTTVEVLAFRPNDVNRARRGPRNATVPYQASPGQVVTIPASHLRRPATNDDTAAYYREHTVSYEGTYYTEEVADQIIRAEPDSDFHEQASFAPREQPRTDRSST